MGKCLICSLVFIPILAVGTFLLCQTVVVQNQASIEINSDVNDVADFLSKLDNMMKLETFDAYEVIKESTSEKVIDGEDTVEKLTVLKVLVTIKVLGKTQIEYTRQIYTTSEGVFHIWTSSNMLGKVECIFIFKKSSEGKTVIEAKDEAHVPRISQYFVKQYMFEHKKNLLDTLKNIFEGKDQPEVASDE